MTYQGDLDANRYGSISMDENVILKASFQQASETFAAAAARGVVDPLRDVSSQLMMGKLPSVGAYGGVDVVVKDVVEKAFDAPQGDGWECEYAPAPFSPTPTEGIYQEYVPAPCSPPHEILEMDLNV